MSLDSSLVILPNLCRMSGALSLVVWVLGVVFTQEN
jgi:hypothetical protein